MIGSGRSRRIAVCEDSKPFAEGLTEFLQRDPELKVVGSFATGEALIAELDGLQVDLVTMDLEVPGMGGLQAIETIMRECPTPILVVSSDSGEGSEGAARALAAGALEAIHKPRSVDGPDPDQGWSTGLRSRIKLLADLRLERRTHAAGLAQTLPPRAGSDHPAQAVAIGASTGGPPALARVLESLPADYPLPVLVVQHITSGFLTGLTAWLQAQISLPVRIAEQGERTGPGVWFAPDGAHLRLEPTMLLSLDHGWDMTGHRPSIDKLFTSVAHAVGRDSVGVVLTGMGRDGAEGVAAIRAAGGRALAQDQQSSAVYGMPRAAAQGGANPILPPEEIGLLLGAMGAAVVRA